MEAGPWSTATARTPTEVSLLRLLRFRDYRSFAQKILVSTRLGALSYPDISGK